MKKKIECIILIDDNKHDNFFHRIVIEESGLCEQVMEFEDPVEALEFFKNDYPNARLENSNPWLVFLDINMPKMDGFEFMEKYNKLPDKNRADLVIMMLTTSKMKDEMDRAKNLGVKEFYNKPLEPEMLQDIIDKSYL